MTGGDRSALARGIPARGGSARALVSIGQVLEELRQEFPDISPSKIRFLEAEGLIPPAARLVGLPQVRGRRHRAAAVHPDRAARRVPAAPGDQGAARRAVDGDGGAGAAASAAALTRSELLEATGADEALLAELEDYGLVRRARAYGTEALTVVRCAVAAARVRHPATPPPRGQGGRRPRDLPGRTGGRAARQAEGQPRARAARRPRRRRAHRQAARHAGRRRTYRCRTRIAATCGRVHHTTCPGKPAGLRSASGR